MGTDLDMILRSNGIHTLVLCGVVTSGVVLSTLCHAADSDYRLVVLRDCCSDIDQAAHALLMEKVFPRHATLLTSAELIDILRD
jgi:nicotinamidase-related amidase